MFRVQIQLERIVTVRKGDIDLIHCVNQQKHIIKNTANVLAIPGAEKNTISILVSQFITAIQNRAPDGFPLLMGKKFIAYLVMAVIRLISQLLGSQFPGIQFPNKFVSHLFFPVIQNQN
jgi:hypothetical protein